MFSQDQARGVFWLPHLVPEDNDSPMLMDSRSHELIQEKGKVSCLSSTMTKTQREIFGHLWATPMAGGWNQLEAPFLTCLPPWPGLFEKLGSARTVDSTTYPQPLHMTKTSHSTVASFQRGSQHLQSAFQALPHMAQSQRVGGVTSLAASLLKVHPCRSPDSRARN